MEVNKIIEILGDSSYGCVNKAIKKQKCSRN